MLNLCFSEGFSQLMSNNTTQNERVKKVSVCGPSVVGQPTSVQQRKELKGQKEEEEGGKRERSECQAHANCFYFREQSCFQTDLRRVGVEVT